MKKVFLSLSLLLVLVLIFSCTKSFEPRLSTVDVKLNIKGVEADEYEVSIVSKDGIVYSNKFASANPSFTLKNIQPGDYEIKAVALKNNTVIGEGKANVSINSSLLATEVFVTQIDMTLDVNYWNRASQFTVTQPANDKIKFEFVEDPGYQYKIYAYSAVDKAWIPLNDGNPVSSGYEVTIENGRIAFNIRKTKYLELKDIEVFGIEAIKDGKTSGIAPAPVLYDRYKTDGAVRSSAAIWKDYAFIASDDGKLYAFKIDNNTLVKKDEIEVSARGLTSPIVEEKSATQCVLYFGGSNGYVYRLKFNTTDGNFIYDSTKDSYYVGARVEASAVVVGKLVIFGTYDGKVWSFNKDDYEKLSDSFAQTKVHNKAMAILSSPIVIDNYVYFPFSVQDGENVYLYFARVETDGGNVNLNIQTYPIGESYARQPGGAPLAAVAGSPAYDSTNNAIWFATTEGVLVKVTDYDTNPEFDTKFLGLGRIDSSPIVVSGNLYIGTDSGYVVCVNTSSMGIEWKYYTGNDARGSRDAVRSTPLLSASGTLFVGSYEGYIYALDANNGSLKWRYQAMPNGRVWSSPALDEGRLIIGSHDGNVYMLRVFDQDLANGWSKWRKDNWNIAKY